MTLIKSISGIRGTIGGQPGNSLTPIDVVKFTAAYAATLPQRKPQPNGERYKVVVGKDARMSGDMVEQLVVGTLIGCGIDVVKCGFASTPTTEMAVLFAKADGGIILTAVEGQAVLDLAEKEDFNFAEVDGHRPGAGHPAGMGAATFRPGLHAGQFHRIGIPCSAEGL